MTGISKNFEGTIFHLIFVVIFDRPLFFQILKALHKFEFKCLTAKIAIAMVLRTLIIFEIPVLKY